MRGQGEPTKPGQQPDQDSQPLGVMEDSHQEGTDMQMSGSGAIGACDMVSHSEGMGRGEEVGRGRERGRGEGWVAKTSRRGVPNLP